MIFLHVFSYKVTYKIIRADRHTDTNETFRAEAGKSQICREKCQSGAGGDDTLRYIKRDLLRDSLSREDDCLTNTELQSSFFLEDGLKFKVQPRPEGLQIVWL